jgi:hypothetical protein
MLSVSVLTSCSVVSKKACCPSAETPPKRASWGPLKPFGPVEINVVVPVSLRS